MIDRVGIIGAGHLAGYLVEGLRKASPELRILLSDRDRAKAETMATRWKAVSLPDNQSLVNETELLLLALRPIDAVLACKAIDFRLGQVVASAVAGLSLAELEAAIAPAEAVRIMPISSAALNQSPTLLYPEHRAVHGLMSLLGSVQVLPDEAAFAAASVIAAFYGWLYALADETVDWAIRAGVPSGAARSLVLETMRSTATMGLQSDQPLPAMLALLATPGGLTELGLGILRQPRGLEAWTEALDAVMERLAPSH